MTDYGRVHPESERSRLVQRREVLISYLRSCVEVADWHAVSDAANDLRCIEVAMERAE